MKFTNLPRKLKKKAISPVIAAVLLLGLVVFGSAVLMFMVMPLLNPAAEFDITSAYLFYDNDRTITYRHGVAEVRFSLQQLGTAQVEITSIQLYYAKTAVVEEGTEIGLVDIGDGASIISMQPAVTPTESQEITTTGTNFVLRFKLPDISETTPLDYKITVNQARGESVSTSFGDDNMNLGKDAPNVDITLDEFVRLTVPLAASATDVHGGIANVTYSIYEDGNPTAIHEETVDTVPYAWNWNTRDGQYDNGDYRIEVSARDYAGWSDTVIGNLTVENDYIAPTIIDSLIKAPYTNQTGERGEPIVIEANVTDTGYTHFNPVVAAVYLNYQLNKTGAEAQDEIAMNLVTGDGTSGTYRGSIPSSFVDHEAITNNLTYYIRAIDSVGNTSFNPPASDGKIIQVADHYAPDFDHTTVTTASELANVQILANVTDKDIPASQVFLYYRKSADTIFTAEPEGTWHEVEMNNVEGYLFEESITYSSVTFDGVDYFMNATDIYGNTRYDGTPGIPHHINVVDITSPSISHVIRSSVVADTNLIITAQVGDNDPAFWYNTSIHNGTVRLHYRISEEGGYEVLLMSYVTGADPFWEAIIEYSGNYSFGSYGIDYYISATDASGNTGYSGGVQEPNHVKVIQAGTSNIAVTSTVTLLTTDMITDNTMEFEITNNGDSSATITHFLFRIYNATGPGLYEIYIDDSLKWGSGTVTNNTEINIDDVVLTQDSTSDVILVFNGRVANKTMGGIFYDLDFIVSSSQHDVSKVKIQKDYALNVLAASWDRNDRFDFNLQRLGDTLIISKAQVIFSSTSNLDRFKDGRDDLYKGSASSGEWFGLDPIYNFEAGSNTFRLEFDERDIRYAAPFYITFETADGYLIALTPITPV